MDTICCTLCGHLNSRIYALLGKLGRATWYRCRNCGGTFKGGK